MNFYSKDEVYVIALDFDGTISKRPFSRAPLDEAPQEGFVWFYREICTNHPEIVMVLHTTRYLEGDNDYWSTRKYLERWGLTKICFPKRDGHTFKNMEGEVYQPFAHYGVNSKLPFAICIDDRNIGTPMLQNGELDWHWIYEMVEEDLRQCEAYWKEKDNACE